MKARAVTVFVILFACVVLAAGQVKHANPVKDKHKPGEILITKVDATGRMYELPEKISETSETITFFEPQAEDGKAYVERQHPELDRGDSLTQRLSKIGDKAAAVVAALLLHHSVQAVMVSEKSFFIVGGEKVPIDWKKLEKALIPTIKKKWGFKELKPRYVTFVPKKAT